MFEQNNLGVRKTSPIVKDLIQKQQEILLSNDNTDEAEGSNNNNNNDEVIGNNNIVDDDDDEDEIMLDPEIFETIEPILEEIEQYGIWNGEEHEEGEEQEEDEQIEGSENDDERKEGNDSNTTTTTDNGNTNSNDNNNVVDISELIPIIPVPGTEEDFAVNTLSIGDLKSYFPPLDGTALFTIICCMNHSCDPNIVIEWDDDPNEPLKANVKAVRPIEIGEELSFSYIDCNLPYEERQFKLRDYGFVCQCNKCKVESMRVGD